MAFTKEKAHERAERFAAKGQHDRAAKEYQTIVENDPKDVRAWLMLADCLVRCGDRLGAIDRYLQVASYYAGQKQPQKALAVYRQVLNLDATRLDVHLKCAHHNMELGRVHDAVQSYEQVAHAQLQAGHVNEALATYQIIADADPTVVSKRLRLAELFSREKQVDKAVGAFRQAGDQLLATHRLQDYVRVAERLLYHRNEDQLTIRHLARVYLELGDPRRALMKLNSLLHADQTDRDGLELLAETFVALQKPDKAASVIVELVRELRHGGGEDREEAIRVLHKGLGWDSRNPSLLRHLEQLEGAAPMPAAEPAPAPMDEKPESEPLELDDEDVVEIDDSDLILTEDAEALPAGRGSMTDSVLSEVGDDPGAEPDGTTDFDKILFEARVYVKYRLFEHALDHVQELLDLNPQHVGALSLRARALSELERRQEAADTHAMVAQLVGDRDPKLAREHVQAALSIVPSHPRAAAMQGDLGLPDPEPHLIDTGDGDSGAFEVVTDHSSGLLLDGGQDAAEPEFDIDVADAEPETDAETTRPFPVENRFGLSGADHLPQDEARRENTPPAGFVPRPPKGEDDGVVITLHDQAFDDETGAVDLDVVSLHEPLARPTDPTGPLGRGDDTDAGGLSSSPTPMPGDVPPVPLPTQSKHPDISDDVAEIRFYMDQGLEDDAEAALTDLRKRYPEHPDLDQLEYDMTAPPTPVSDAGNKPLVTFDESEEEDEFLQAMLAGPGDGQRKKRAPARARAELQQAEAQDHFDLGMAYREMGLVDDAIAQFESAARDAGWMARALVMAGTLRIHRGETDRAVRDLKQAISAASTEDERCEANYELGVLYEKIGDTGAAIEQLKVVTQGFRDRDEKLSDLLR